MDAAFCAHQGLSALLHLGVLAAASLFIPPPEEVEGTAEYNDALIQRLIVVGAGEEGEGAQDVDGEDEVGVDRPIGATGEDETRTMGKPSADRARRRLAVAGPADNADPHIAREAALREAATFPIIGFLQEPADGRWKSEPTAPWGRDESLGNDDLGANGRMWGDSIGDAFGAGGLGLTGIGLGGGGKGQGTSIDGVRIGICDGGLAGGCQFAGGASVMAEVGYGQGTCGGGGGCGRVRHGHLGGAHSVRQPVVTGCETEVVGRLPPEAIQRVVRQNFGRFRLCYEDGLREKPGLRGRVVVKFLIARDGSVGVTSDAGSDLADAAVVSCIVRRFGDLSFPEPAGGTVHVVYPLELAPD